VALAHHASVKLEAGRPRPVGRILMLLLAGVGLPFFILSATAPLLQTWFADARPDSSPYPLYALSNLGAMLGLLTFPFLVETTLNLRLQAQLWFALYLFFALGSQCVLSLCAAAMECSRALRMSNPSRAPVRVRNRGPPPRLT
jgi:hypothetical protein